MVADVSFHRVVLKYVFFIILEVVALLSELFFLLIKFLDILEIGRVDLMAVGKTFFEEV